MVKIIKQTIGLLRLRSVHQESASTQHLFTDSDDDLMPVKPTPDDHSTPYPCNARSIGHEIRSKIVSVKPMLLQWPLVNQIKIITN